jgi:hypothetical protein
MQLHPECYKDRAAEYAVQALARGFVGFSFWSDPGDLRRVELSSLPDQVGKPEVEFATEMNVGDKILVFVHQYPFALVMVASDYCYRPRPRRPPWKWGEVIFPELGVWFNHFRRVKDVWYYADYKTNPRDWEQIPTPMTIQRLTASKGKVRELIQRWLDEVG